MRGRGDAAVDDLKGPYVLSGGWWRGGVAREYYFARTRREEWLWVFRDTKRRCVVFLISDFLTPGWRRALRVAARRHDVVAVVLEDPREAELPAVGLVELEEAETGERYVVDTRDWRVRDAFARQASIACVERDRDLRATDVDAIVVGTDRPYTEALLRFFRMRERRA